MSDINFIINCMVFVGIILCFIPVYLRKPCDYEYEISQTSLGEALESQELHDALLSSVTISIPLIFEHLLDNTMTNREGNIFRLIRVFGLFIPNLIVLVNSGPHSNLSIISFIPPILATQLMLYIYSFFSLLNVLDPMNWNDRITIYFITSFTMIIVLYSSRGFSTDPSIPLVNKQIDLTIGIFFYISFIIFLWKVLRWLHHIYVSIIKTEKSLTHEQYICSIQIVGMVLFLIIGRGALTIRYGFVQWADVNYGLFSGWIYVDIIVLILNMIFSDRLSRKELLMAQNALEIKRNFVNYISHEMRTPLNTVFLGLKLLQDDFILNGDSEDRLEIVNDIKTSCDISLSILNELLTFDKLESGKLKLEISTIQVWEFLMSTVKPFEVQAQHAGIELEFADEEATAMMMANLTLEGDEHKLAQVMRNFVSNALKFTPRGGKITIVVRTYSQTLMDTNQSEHDSNSVAPPGVHPGVPNMSSSNGILRSSGSTTYGPLGSNSPSGLNNSSGIDTPNINSSKHSNSSKLHGIRVASFENIRMQVQEATASVGSLQLASSAGTPPSAVRMLRVDVVDTGAGISTENQKKVFKEVIQFNPGKLQKGGGSGLGLYITRGIVELHHGTVSVFSAGEGCGSTFTVELPLSGPVSQPPPAQISPPPSITSLLGATLMDIANKTRSVSFDNNMGSTSPQLLRQSVAVRPPERLNSISSAVTEEDPRARVYDHRHGLPSSNTLPEELQHEEHLSSDVKEEEDAREPSVHEFVREINDENSVTHPQLRQLNNNTIPYTSSPLAQPKGLNSHMMKQAKEQAKDQGNNQIRDRKTLYVSTRMESLEPAPFKIRKLQSSNLGDSNRSEISGSSFMASMKGLNKVIPPPSRVIPTSPSMLMRSQSALMRSHSALLSSGSGGIRQPRRRNVADQLRVLVVDDSLMNRKMLCRHLRKKCEVIYEADDGSDAIDTLKQAGLAGKVMDVVLMDHQMPVMDGPTATKGMRALGFKGMIIGVTGNALPHHIQIYMNSGADYVLTKPLDLSRLEAILSEFGETIPKSSEPVVPRGPIRKLFRMLSKSSSKSKASSRDIVRSVSNVSGFGPERVGQERPFSRNFGENSSCDVSIADPLGSEGDQTSRPFTPSR